MIEFANRLKEILSVNGWTKAHLANVMEISPGTLSGYLADKNNPQINDVSRFAKNLGVSIAWLCGEEDKKGEKLFLSNKASCADIISIFNEISALNGFRLVVGEDDSDVPEVNIAFTDKGIHETPLSSTVYVKLLCDSKEIVNYYETSEKLKELVKEGRLNQMEFNVIMDSRRKVLNDEYIE